MGKSVSTLGLLFWMLVGHALPAQDLVSRAEALRDTHPDSSLAMARRALLLAVEQENYPHQVAVHLLLSRLYTQQAVFSQALNALQQAQTLADHTDDVQLQSQVQVAMGDLYERTHQPQQALRAYQQARQYYERAEDRAGLAQVYGSLGHLYEKQSQYDSALHYQWAALRLCQQLADTAWLGTIHDHLGSIFEDLAQYDTARAHFEAAYGYHRQAGQWEYAVITLNNLGDVYRKTNRWEQGIPYTLQALAQAREYNLNYQRRSAYRDLAKTYAELGQPALAYAYQDSAYSLNADIYNEEIARQIAHNQALYEVEQKEQQIVLLEKDRALGRVQQRALLGGVAFVVVLAGLLVYQQRSRGRKNRQLYEKERALHEVERMNTQLRERQLQAELENKRLREEQLNRELESHSKSLTTSALHLIQKNEFLEGLREQLRAIRKADPEAIAKKLKKLAQSIDFSFNLDKDWEEFERVFQQVHQDFLDALLKKYPDLTAAEVKLCAMLRLNLNSKDMASIMGISQDSLRIARYRLRKKLGLEKGSNLYSFIQQIDQEGNAPDTVMAEAESPDYSFTSR